MKSINVPLVEGLEGKKFSDIMESLQLQGSRFMVDEIDWPEGYPYAPICVGHIARTSKSLVVSFHVSGLDLRAVNLQDNMSQWEDSTVEVFVQSPDGSEYFNFEMNCVGTILAARGAGRGDRQKRSPEQVASIIRYSSLPLEETMVEGGVHSWDVVELIPFELLGVDSQNLPKSLKGNFYKCGDLTAHPHFLSWNRVDTPSPDFHRPEFFGDLILG